MRRAFDYFVYLALRAAWAVARRVPLGALRAILGAASILVYHADAHHRRITLQNLRLAFPAWSEREREHTARAAFRNWARISAELVHADEMASGRTLDTIRTLERKAAELGAGGRGVLALTAHTANFELLARLLGKASGRRVVLFHRRMANPFVGELLLRDRAGSNVTTLGRGMVVREALRVLAGGEILVVPLDQNQARKRGVFVDFFGHPACTSTMLARLSLATGLPVQPAFAIWEGDDLVASLGEAISPPVVSSRAERARAVHDLTARYTRQVEEIVRLHPSQWNWAHRRWKTRPPVPAPSTVREGPTGSASPGTASSAELG